MKRFHLTPERRVIVEDGDRIYNDTIANFEADFKVDIPATEEDVERLYQPGKRHTLIKDGSVIDGGPLNWPQGDQLIAAIDPALVLKHARDNPPPTPEEQAILDASAAYKIKWDQRVANFAVDTDRQGMVDALKDATPAQIETYVRTRINADAVTNVASAASCLKRMENALVALTKTIALTLNR